MRSKIHRSHEPSEHGQATLEYILLLFVVITIVSLISKQLLNSIDSSLLSFGGTLERQLKTGRTGVNAYNN